MKRLIVLSNDGCDIPFLPLFEDLLHQVPKHITMDDVFLFEGGTDVNPKLYGQSLGKRTQYPDVNRDEYEQSVFQQAQKAGAACIGICRGSQFLTVMNGGTLIQHVNGHSGRHGIILEDGSTLVVTSTHHQMCNPFDLPKENYQLIGWANKLSDFYLGEDNLDLTEDIPVEPEIIWYPKTRSLAIQGHPEYVGSQEPFPTFCRELVKKFIFNKKH